MMIRREEGAVFAAMAMLVTGSVPSRAYARVHAHALAHARGF